MKKKLNYLARFLLFYLVLSFFLMTTSEAIGQIRKVTVNEVSITLKDVIEKIAEQSGYNFLYNVQLIDVNQKVTISKTDTDIKLVLEELFRDKKIDFKIIDKQIVLSPKDGVSKSNQGKNVPTSTGKPANGKFAISGRVVDESGAPLAGCTVNQQGFTNAAITDDMGRYIINTVTDNPTLVFSFIGMKTEAVKATSGEVNVKMVSDILQLEQFVVTGYQTLKKFNTTGAVNTLDSKKIEARSASSLNKLLEGSVPGLSVYKGDYRIRGGSSLSSGTRPMFIVDDFEVETLPENMDVVESITVLKDAAAAAIWGSRAANGVIVITTKQGKSNDFKITYSSNYKVSSKPNFSDLRRADSQTLIDYQKEAYQKEYILPYIYEGSSSGYPESYQIFFDRSNGLINDAEMDSRLAKLGKLSNSEQIKKNLLRNSFVQNHLISFSGGADKINYYLSGAYSESNSVYKGDKNNSLNINLRSSYKLYSFLKLRADINATFGKSDNGYTNLSSDIYDLFPFQMLTDQNGGYIYNYDVFNKVEAGKLKGLGYKESGQNILEELNLANNKSTSTAYKVRVGADFKIIEGLGANIDYQYERVGNQAKNIRSRNSYYARELINRMTSSTNGVLKLNIPDGDILDQTISNTSAFVGKAGLNLNRSFGADQKHYVNAVLGFEIRKRVTDSGLSRKLGYDDQLLTWQPIDQITMAQSGIMWWDGKNQRYYADTYDSFGYNDNRETSSYGSLVYTYDNRYTLSGSMRFDESNLFGADKKFRRNPIWSIGANWNIAQEKFFKSKVITDLSLRTAYGLTGNFDRTGSTTPVMVARRSYLSSIGGYVTRISTPPNPSLRWEKTKSFNVSASIGLWNRVSATVDYYINNSYDLLGQTILDPTVGFASARINAADMSNKGVELNISGDIIRKKDFTWNAGFVASYNKNKVTRNSVSDGAPQLNRPSGTTKYVEGYARETIWSYKWAGLDAAGNPQTFDADGKKTYTVSLASLEASGTYQPKYNGSFYTGITYKGFNLNCMFVYNFGHVFRVEYPSMNPWESSPSTSELIGKRWRKPGDEATTDIPGIWVQDWANYIENRESLATRSSNSIRDGGFIRLRELQLNYSISDRILKKTPFSRIALMAQLNSLGLWTVNKEGYDPEAIGTDEISRARGTLSLREPMSFTFGLKLDF